MAPDDLDRRAPDRAQAQATTGARAQLRRADFTELGPYRAPRGPMQIRLVRLWREALNIDRVGADDDFFALGGDSMTATLMFAELERVLGRKLATATLLKASTIAELARLLREDPRDYAAQILVPMRTGGTRPPLVLVHGHNGRVLFVRRLAWLLPAEYPVFAIQARGFDASPPHASVPEMLDEYVRLLHETFGEREIHLGGYCYGGILAIEIHRRLQAQGGPRVRRLLAIDPPVFPRRAARDYTPAELADLARLHSEGLAKRIDQVAFGDPKLTAWYSPGGQGYATLMHVAEQLAKAYSGFVAEPTTAPMTLIWSQQFANALRSGGKRWRLARGPTETRVVALAGQEVSHLNLLGVALPLLGRALEQVLASADEDRRTEVR